MVCLNCQGELRIGPEQVSVDKDNLPVFHRFGYCDKCMLKYDIDLFMQAEKGNNVSNNLCKNLNKEKNKNQFNPNKKSCPLCGGYNYHAFVEEVVIREGKTKAKTSLNLNPLKPFTVFNHKEKVVRKPITKKISKFVCDDCGNIF